MNCKYVVEQLAIQSFYSLHYVATPDIAMYCTYSAQNSSLEERITKKTELNNSFSCAVRVVL